MPTNARLPKSAAPKRALLVHEGDQPERALRLDAPLLEQADRLQTAEHAERAVVAAAARNRVEVRADHDRGAGASLPATDQVAGGVELHLEPELLQLAGQPGQNVAELGRPRETRDAGALAAECCCRLDVGDDPPAHSNNVPLR